MRTRDEVRAALDGNFKQLMDCLGQLTEDELTSTAVTGEWTVKDVISHIWVWNDEAVRTLKAWQGPRPWQDDFVYDDAWSEAQVSAKRILPFITVVDGVTGSHRRLMHYLDLAEDELLAQPGRAPRGEEMTYTDFVYSLAEHYNHHLEAVKRYQVRCLGTTD